MRRAVCSPVAPPPCDSGFVLAAMLVMLVIASAILGGAFFYALQEERIGRNQLAAARALAAAEGGAARVVADWSAAREGAVLPGESLVLAPPLAPGEGSASVVLVPLGETAAMLRSRGDDPTGTARRDVAVLVRLLAPRIQSPAALVAVAGVSPALAAAVDGDDHVPAGWSCGPPAPNRVVLAPWSAAWDDWDSLAARAVVGARLPDAATPAVLVEGDFNLIGGSGTGILLVTGDMRIDGGAMLTGVLLVRGTLTFTGSAGKIVGGVRAGSIGADSIALFSRPLISWSACAVARARRALAVPALLQGYSWADLDGGW